MLSAYRRYLTTLNNPETRPFTPALVSNTMRGSYDSYKIFYQKFVSCIVGKRLFETRLQTCDSESKIATVSDEALALLGFENAYPVWSDIWEKSEGKIRQVNKDEEIPECFKSSKHTLYTTRRDSEGVISGDKGKDWSAKGIDRFNFYRQKVKKDRKNHKDFITRFLEDWRKLNKSKPAPVVDQTMPDAEDDFNDNTPVSTPVKPAKGKIGVEDDDSDVEQGSDRDHSDREDGSEGSKENNDEEEEE